MDAWSIAGSKTCWIICGKVTCWIASNQIRVSSRPGCAAATRPPAAALNCCCWRKWSQIAGGPCSGQAVGRAWAVGLRFSDLHGRAAGIAATVEEIADGGRRRLRFTGIENVLTELDRLGETPLPPYIRRGAPLGQPPGPGCLQDQERYQTVYARASGSVAAPTAGLHFTEAFLGQIRARGVQICFVTLHVGAGTFAPVKSDLVADHRMHRGAFRNQRGNGAVDHSRQDP